MSTELLANAASSILTSAISSTVRPVALSVASATAFPTTGDFRIKIDSEILLVTAVAGTTFTATNVEGTTAATHANGTGVVHVLTASALTRLISDRVGVVDAPAPNGTDDTTALNAVFLTNTSIQLRVGSYIFTSLTIPAGCRVFGARGRQTTLLAKAGTITNQHQRRIRMSGADAAICDVVLDGNRSACPLGTATLGGTINGVVGTMTVSSAANFPNTNDYLVSIDNELVAVTAGAGTTTWTISRGTSGTTAASHTSGATVTYIVADPGSNGFVYIDAGAHRSRVIDCYIKDAPVTAIFGTQVVDCDVSYNRIEDSRWSGIFFRDTCNNCRVTYNHVLRPGNGIRVQSLKGIGFSEASNVTLCDAPYIHGNYVNFDTITTALVWDILAIELFGAPRSIVTDNIIWGPTTSNSPVYGISLASSSQQSLAQGNQIRRNMTLGVEAADDSYGCRYIGNSIYDFATGVSISTTSGNRSDDHMVVGNYFESGNANANVSANAVCAIIMNGEIKRAVINGNSFVDFGAAGIVLLGTNVQDVSITGNQFVVKYQNGAFGNSSLRGVYIQSGSGHIVSGNEFGPGTVKTGDTLGTGAICAVYIIGSGVIEKCIISNNKMNGRNPADNASIEDVIQFEGQVDNTLVMGNIAENTSRSFIFQWSTLGTNSNVIKNNYLLPTVATPFYQGLKSADLVEPVELSIATGSRVAISKRDDFLEGAVSGSGIGDLNWTAGIGGTSAGTHSFVDATIGHPGIFQLATPVTASSRNYLHSMASPTNGNVWSVDYFDLLFIVKLTQTDTNTVFRCGLGNSAEADPPTGGFFVEKLLADTSWFGVNRSAGTQTRTSALFTSDTSWNRVRIRRKSSTEIGFTINALTEALLTTNIPSASLQPFVMIGNNTSGGAVVKSVQIDAFELNIFNLNR